MADPQNWVEIGIGSCAVLAFAVAPLRNLLTNLYLYFQYHQNQYHLRFLPLPLKIFGFRLGLLLLLMDS
jgi:hypothetical protein